MDPWAKEEEAFREYGVRLVQLKDVQDADCVIMAVAHDEFRKMGIGEIKKLFEKSKERNKVLIDVKGIYDVGILEKSGLCWWRL